MIPNRCRSCVHWMGRESEQANDPRCDRGWGWSMSFLGEKRFVEFECKVPLWGDEIPMLDEYGNPLPGDRDSRNPRVDAYLPVRFSREVPETIELRSRDIHGFFTADELGDLLTQMKDTSKLFDKRSARREALTKKNISTHKRKMGSIGQVATADYQPPYETGEERIPTGLVQLDFALRGGLVPGTTIGLWGEKHIGKTTLSHRFEAAILDYYRQRVYAFMIEQGRSEEDAQAAADGEQGLAIATEQYDSTYAGRLGVKTNQVLRPRFEYGEQYLQYIVDHVRDDVKEFAEFKEPGVFSYMLPVSARYYKIDSVDAMKWWSDEHGARNKENVLHDNQKMGARASLLSQFFRVAAAAPSIPITPIFITQERTNMAGTTAWKDGLRGNAFAHNIRLEIRMKKNGSAPKEGDTTRMVDLEFRQLQMAGGTNLTERSVVTLVQRLEGGFYPKDQAVYCAAERGILKIKGGGHWDYDTRSGDSYTGASLDCRTSDIGAIADKLDELGLIPEVYQRVMNVYSGREMDADGNVAALETEIAGDTSVDTDREGARQIDHQEAQS